MKHLITITRLHIIILWHDVIILLILIIITWHCISICRNSNVIPDTVFLYFTFGYYDLHFTIIFKNSFVQPSYNIIILNILSFHSKMLKIYMYMISLCSRLISIYLDLLLVLVSIVSLYFACCHCKGHHVIILWHSIILFYIMLWYYHILWYCCLSYSYFSSWFFPSATCPVCCDVIFILHHPVFTFRSVISVCFRGESENAAKRRNRHNGWYDF